MSLRKSPTLTPALLESNRRNAKKSTGPRIARGKARSRLNNLRNGTRSSEFISFVEALLDAPPGRVGETAKAILLSMPVIHPVYLEATRVAVETEIALTEDLRLKVARRERERIFFIQSKPEGY